MTGRSNLWIALALFLGSTIAAAIEKPQAAVVNTRISTNTSSPYALELMIKSPGVERVPEP